MSYAVTPADAVRLTHLGASVCIPRDALESDVLDAVRAAARGECGSLLSGEMSLPDIRISQGNPIDRIDQRLLKDLTRRELDVCELLCLRLTDGEIASALRISIETVHSHTKRIYRKLQIHGRRDLPM